MLSDARLEIPIAVRTDPDDPWSCSFVITTLALLVKKVDSVGGQRLPPLDVFQLSVEAIQLLKDLVVLSSRDRLLRRALFRAEWSWAGKEKMERGQGKPVAQGPVQGSF